jgi:manganese/zinc/iron transport system permease protein
VSPALYNFVSLDLPAMLAGTLAVVVCGLLGNFLLLRRLSLMGDAISHSVLPGLVAGFLVAGSRQTLPMFLGAAAAGMATVALVEVVRKLARLESGAAMGVIFSILFAAGVLLIEQAAAEGVDLDPDCVLNGQLERIFWFPPNEISAWSFSTLGDLPRELWTLMAITAAAAIIVTVLYKELRLAAFDPAAAHSLGVNPRVINALFMALVATAVVASFEAVGSILVIAMLVCPAAIARLLTDRLSRQLWLSVLASVLIGFGGYACAVFLPTTLGIHRTDGSSAILPLTLNAAGAMTVLAGMLLGCAILFAPRYGVLLRRLAHHRLAQEITREDLLARLFRAEERSDPSPALNPASVALAQARGEIELAPGGARLTDLGRAKARELVRRHRQWEQYLVEQAALRPDHVHPTAERLEHVKDADLAARLAAENPAPQDPHGRPIP